MPLLRFDIVEGRSEKELRKIMDVVHEAIVEALEVPESDRYQVVHQHKPSEMIIQDTGLGFNRTDNFILISIVSSERTEEKKTVLYELIVSKLETYCAISREDVMITISENTQADWSFGNGIAQFLSGDL